MTNSRCVIPVSYDDTLYEATIADGTITSVKIISQGSGMIDVKRFSELPKRVQNLILNAIDNHI